MKYTVEELAKIIEGNVIGDSGIVIEGTKGMKEAGKTDIAFAVGEYLSYIGQAKAGAMIVEQKVDAPMPVIVVENAKVAFAKLLDVFYPPVEVPVGVHETAIIGNNVKIGKNVSIQPYCVICDNAVIGDNTILHPYVYVGHNVKIGEGSELFPSAVVHKNCEIGNRVVLRANAIIGGEGFGFATKDGKHTHIPQVGNVVLEDDVEVGSCSCVDNGTMGSTIVRRGTKIDNLVHLAHNVEIGEDCFLVAQVGIAGSTKCGNSCIFAGQSGSTGHITIGDNCTFAARTGITGHVPDNVQYAGFPMRPHREWLKLSAYESRLPEMAKAIKQLQREIKALKEQK